MQGREGVIQQGVISVASRLLARLRDKRMIRSSSRCHGDFDPPFSRISHYAIHILFTEGESVSIKAELTKLVAKQLQSLWRITAEVCSTLLRRVTLNESVGVWNALSRSLRPAIFINVLSAMTVSRARSNGAALLSRATAPDRAYAEDHQRQQTRMWSRERGDNVVAVCVYV